jgi:hypothetical protein
VAKVGTSNQDRTIPLKAAVRSGINKQDHVMDSKCRTAGIFSHIVSSPSNSY